MLIISPSSALQVKIVFRVSFQMARIDENQEVIARIRMLLDNYDKTQRSDDADNEELPDEEERHKTNIAQRHWSLGAPEQVTTARALQQSFQHEQNSFYQQFEGKLKSFLRKNVSDDCIGKDEPLKVCWGHLFNEIATDSCEGSNVQMPLSTVSVSRELDCGTRHLTVQPQISQRGTLRLHVNKYAIRPE